VTLPVPITSARAKSARGEWVQHKAGSAVGESYMKREEEGPLPRPGAKKASREPLCRGLCFVLWGATMATRQTEVRTVNRCPV
jgi:hypothetical protein